MNETLLALQLLSGLTSTISNYVDMQHRINDILKDANENNDGKLTEDQIKQIREVRSQAMKEFDDSYNSMKSE